ncbi:hypothetical protein MLD38_012027 [Melastoma candidum]|uniref:Uncharacterized protein n=1 Tax=Melastoma candidum TaxID=119954 RepID=A0ACB9R619_9MYRT|nr:hypothetical protein MLD38_012027 [Melastoma candidum]
MASGSSMSGALGLLILNLLLYFVITAIAAWTINHGIERSRDTAAALTLPVRIFPMYFPVGNMATGFFVIFSLIAGVVGMITSITGAQNMTRMTAPNVYAAAASSLVALSLTLLALGLACKEIRLGRTESNLRTLEVMTVIASVTQLLCTGAIQDEIQRIPVRHNRASGGRA